MPSELRQETTRTAGFTCNEQLRELAIRPWVFEHLQKGHRWFAFYSREDLCGYAAIGEISSIQATIHFEWVVPITARSFKDALRAFRRFLVPELKSMGYEQLVATKPYDGKNTEPWVRFIKRFGWPEPTVALVSVKEL